PGRRLASGDRRARVRTAHRGHEPHDAVQPQRLAGDQRAVGPLARGRADRAAGRRPPGLRLAGARLRGTTGARGAVTLALDLFVNGLIFGLFYALMAVGLAMIFGVLKVVNFAHGEFYMVGAYTYVLCALKLGVPAWLALPRAAIAGAFLGWLVERT